MGVSVWSQEFLEKHAALLQLIDDELCEIYFRNSNLNSSYTTPNASAEVRAGRAAFNEWMQALRNFADGSQRCETFDAARETIIEKGRRWIYNLHAEGAVEITALPQEDGAVGHRITA